MELINARPPAAAPALSMAVETVADHDPANHRAAAATEGLEHPGDDQHLHIAGDPAHHLGIGADDAELHRVTDGRPQLKPGYPHPCTKLLPAAWRSTKR